MLVKVMVKPDYLERFYVVRTLAGPDDHRALNRIRNALNDDNRIVRDVAQRVLGTSNEA